MLPLDPNRPTPIDEAAGLLGITRQRLAQIQKSGHIPPGTTLPLCHWVRGHAESLKRQGRPGSDVKTALVEEQTRRLRLENDTTEGNLVDMELVIDLTKIWAGAVQSELANWSARITRDPKLRAQIDDQADQSLRRIGATVEKASAELFGPLDDGDDEAEAA